MTDGLPVNLDAERFVLGSILLDGTRLAEVDLTPDDFSIEKHRRIFKRMLEMRERGETVERASLILELQRLGELESCDGFGYIVTLDEGLPELPHIDSYVQSVRDTSTLRRIIYSSQHMINRATKGDEQPAAILAGAREELVTLSERTVKTTLVGPAEVIEREGGLSRYLDRRARARGASWGLPSLDVMTGGLEPGKVYVIGARPRMGKTSFAVGVADAAAKSVDGVSLVFSLEMGDVSLIDRMVCSRAMIDLRRFAGGYLTREEEQRAAKAAGEIAAENRIRVDDKAITDLGQIHAKIRAFQAREKIAVVVIDYLQLLLSGKEQYRVAEMSKISRNAKVMAKDCGVPLIALSQLSRAVDDRQDHKPMLSDLRESGAIEQDADMVGLLYRAEVYSPDSLELKGLADLIVAKQRDGPEGTVELVFMAASTRFQERAR